MNTRSPQALERVTQWGHGARIRSVFLLAALAVPALVSPPDAGLILTANAPTVTTEPSADVIVGTQTTFVENVTVQRSATAGVVPFLVISTTIDTPESLAVHQTTLIETARVQRSATKRAAATLALSASADPGNVYAPVGTLTFTAYAPEIEVTDLLPCALSDDGRWPEPPPFIAKPSALLAFTLDQSIASPSPPAASILLTAYAPAVSVSDNALVDVPAGGLTFTAYAPAITIFGAPNIDVPTAYVLFEAFDPEVVGVADTKLGGDDAPIQRAVEPARIVYEKTNPNIKRSTLKLKREKALDEELRSIYRTLTANPETAEEAEEIVAPVVTPLAAVDAPVNAPVEEPTVERKAEILATLSEAREPAALQAETALRLLYQQHLQDEADEQAAIEALLGQLL